MFKNLLIFSGLLLMGLFSHAQDFPARSNTLVTDFTNTLSADEKQRLENKLVAFDDSTGIQIAVVMMRSIGDYDVNEYATELGRRWGVGGKDKNTGVVILVAKDDRKLSIQTGYGMEGQLPDVITQQIRVNEMNPRFKEGDFYGGLDAGTDAIIKYNKGEYKAEPRKVKQRERKGDSPIGIVVVIIIIILVMIFRKGGGGGGQVIGRRGSASPFWWLLAGSMMNSGNRGGGGWGGGGFGGGSSGGGGFGGFGGGSFVAAAQAVVGNSLISQIYADFTDVSDA